MKIVFRKKAEMQLSEIFAYNHENESEKRASKIIESIVQEIDKIEYDPFRFLKHKKFQDLKSDTRKAIVHKTFIITFRIFKNHIAILNIYHGKRKPI